MKKVNTRLFIAFFGRLMHKMLLYSFFIISVFLAFVACESSDICRESTDTPLRIGFYSSDDGAEMVIIDSITVFGIGREDTLIYNNARNVSRVEVPLNVSKDTTSIGFLLRETIDTLTVIYNREINLISIGCGFVSFFDIEDISYTTNEFNSIYIENNSVRNDINEHFKIYISDTDTDID